MWEEFVCWVTKMSQYFEDKFVQISLNFWLSFTSYFSSDKLRGGGHFNFICTGGCGHRIGKFGPIRRLKLAQKQTHSQTICNRNWLNYSRFYSIYTKNTHSQVKLYQNYDPSAGFWSKIYTHPEVFGLENSPILAAHP